MEITGCRNLHWADPDKKAIACEICANGQWVAFIAMPDDVMAHGREIFARAQSGEYGAIVDYVAPPPKPPVEEGKGPRALG